MCDCDFCRTFDESAEEIDLFTWTEEDERATFVAIPGEGGELWSLACDGSYAGWVPQGVTW